MHAARLLRSSTFRLALVYMALFAASVLILLAFIYWSTAAYMARQVDATIETEIAGLAEQYRTRGLTGLSDLIGARVARKPSGSSIYLLVDRAFAPVVGNLSRWPDVPPAEDGWLNFRLEGQGWPRGEIHRARARAFRLEGGFHLLVGRDIHDLEETQALIVNTLIWGLLMTLVLALLGGVVMTRSMLRRIEAINQTSREIMSGDLTHRIPSNQSGDDFDVLIGNLNAMLDRIESLMEGVRRVSDNIAHDLKTPLTRLRHSLEVLRAEAAEPDTVHALTEQAVGEAERLLSTFNALLRIARVESAESRAAFADVRLADLVRDVADLYEPLAEEKGQRLVAQVADGVCVRGDRDLLFQALANLLDNAVKYTPPGGTISVGLENRANGPHLTVADSGPGVPAQARGKVFQRFFRLEESRTTPGSGLGLSLVAAVAQLHGAGVRLSDNQPGLRVTLEFSANPACGKTEPAGRAVAVLPPLT